MVGTALRNASYEVVENNPLPSYKSLRLAPLSLDNDELKTTAIFISWGEVEEDSNALSSNCILLEKDWDPY